MIFAIYVAATTMLLIWLFARAGDERTQRRKFPVLKGIGLR